MTTKQRKFIAVYLGNGTDAARLAGYKGSANVLGKTAHDLLRNPKISKAIKRRETSEVRPMISTRLERQKFWSEVMVDEKIDMRDRLRASELLGRSEADFTEKVQASFNWELAERLKESRTRMVERSLKSA